MRITQTFERICLLQGSSAEPIVAFAIGTVDTRKHSNTQCAN